MEKVKKTEKKKVPLWVGVIIIATLLLTTGILYKLSKHVDLPPLETKAEKIEIMRVPIEEIVSITVYPTQSDPYTILQAEEGTYTLKNNKAYPLRKNTLDEMFEAVSSMVADNLVVSKVDSVQLPDFGVTDASLHFILTTKDGLQSTWYFGHELHMEVPQRYLYDGQNIYITSINYPDILNFSIKELHPVPQINYTPDIIDSIVIQKGEDLLSLDYLHGLWQMTSPYRYPADTQAMKDLLEKLGNMRLAVFVEDADAKNLATYGLDDPRASLTLKIAPSVISVISPEQELLEKQNVAAHSVELFFGDPFDDIGFYCLFEGTIYKATNLSMGFLLHVEADSLLLKTPFNIALNAMEQIDVVRPEGKATYHLSFVEQLLPNNEFVRDDMGNIQHDIVVTKNNIPMEASVFTAEYVLMSRLRAAGNIKPGSFTPSTSPIISITLRFEQGERTVAFYPYDSLHVAISIDGNICHYMEKEKLDTITL